MLLYVHDGSNPKSSANLDTDNSNFTSLWQLDNSDNEQFVEARYSNDLDNGDLSFQSYVTKADKRIQLLLYTQYIQHRISLFYYSHRFQNFYSSY